MDWVGDIPKHWEVHRLKHIASVQFSSVDKHTIEGEEVVRLCNYVDVYYNDFIKEGLEFMSATATRSEIARFQLRHGDVLVTKDSESWDDIAVPAYVAEELDGVLCGYHLAHIRPDLRKLIGEYLFRAFRSRGINDQFRVAANGITRFGLGKYWLDNGLFPVPPPDEQKAIAAFLDRETARIDALIEKKQRQIELLQEKRSALINHAVTKGLDPNAKMKDSGIEWMGKVPEHWQVKRLRFTAKVNPVKSEVAHLLPDTEVSFVPMEAVNEYGGLNLYQTNRIEDVYQGYTYFRDGDVVIAKITPCFENGKGSIATGLANGVGFGTTELHVVRPLLEIDRQFFFYLSISIAFRQSGEAEMYGAGGQKRVPDSFIRDYRCPLPPMEEQQHIVAFLDSQTDKLDAMVEKINVSIDMLREHRTALISAVVTGKIDVRKEVSA
jgi:type I restriction enzyme S subunit